VVLKAAFATKSIAAETQPVTGCQTDEMAPAPKVCRECLGLLDAWGAATRAHAELALGMSKVAASGDRAAFAAIHRRVAAVRRCRMDARTAYIRHLEACH
jgi:hypothetical protein